MNGHTARVPLAGSADLSTLDATSRAIGDHETVRTSTSTGADGQRSVSRSEQDSRLAPVECLRQLPPDTAVVLYGRLPPRRVRTTPWWSDRSLRAMVEAPDLPPDAPTVSSRGAGQPPAGTTPSPAIPAIVMAARSRQSTPPTLTSARNANQRGRAARPLHLGEP